MPDSPSLEAFKADLEQLKTLSSTASQGTVAGANAESEAEFLRGRLRESAEALLANRPFLRASLDKIRAQMSPRAGKETAPEDAPERSGGVLHFYELLAKDWEEKARQKPSEPAQMKPVDSMEVRTIVENELYARVFRTRAAQACLAILVASVGFAVYGAVKFNGIELNITKLVTDKRNELEAELEAQRVATRKLTDELKTSIAAAQDGRRDVDAKIAEAKMRVGQLETDADRVISNFSRDINRKYGAKFEDSLEKLDDRIKSSTKEANEAFDKALATGTGRIANAATARADELLVSPPNPKFSEWLKTLQTSTDASSKQVATLKAQLDDLAGKQLLVSKAMGALTLPERSQVDRYAGYLYEVLWVVYGAAGVLVLLTAVNAYLAWRARG